MNDQTYLKKSTMTIIKSGVCFSYSPRRLLQTRDYKIIPFHYETYLLFITDVNKVKFCMNICEIVFKCSKDI
jgi:hypothetical protein